MTSAPLSFYSEEAEPPEEQLTTEDLIERFSPSTDMWDRLRQNNDLSYLEQESRDHGIESDRRRVLERAEQFGDPVDERVYDILNRSPGVSPDTLAGLVDLEEDEYGAVVQDILDLDSEVNASEIAAGVAEPGSINEAAADVPWHERALMNGVKGVVRNALITASLPVELLTATGRSVYGAAREGDWGSAAISLLGAYVPGAEAFLPEGRVGPYEQTHFYQAYLSGVGNETSKQGRGWIPSYEEGFVGKAQEDIATSVAQAGKGDVGWTYGRGFADANGWDPDSNRYKLVSGLIDLGVNLADPLILVGKVGKVARAAKMAERARKQAEASVQERRVSTAARRAQEQIDERVKQYEEEIARLEAEDGVTRAEAEVEIENLKAEMDDAAAYSDELDAIAEEEVARMAQSVDADRLADAQNRRTVLIEERDRLLRERDVLARFADGGAVAQRPGIQTFNSRTGTKYVRQEDGKWRRQRRRSRESEVEVGAVDDGPVDLEPLDNTVWLTQEDADAVDMLWNLGERIVDDQGRLLGRFYDNTDLDQAEFLRLNSQADIARDDAWVRAGGRIETRPIDDIATEPEVGRFTTEWQDDLSKFHPGSRVMSVGDDIKGPITKNDVSRAVDRLMEYVAFPGVVTWSDDAPEAFSMADTVSVALENGDVVTVRTPRVYDNMPEAESAASNRLSGRVNELQQPDATIQIGGTTYYHLPELGVYSTNMWDIAPNPVRGEYGPMPGMIPDGRSGNAIYVADELIDDVKAHIQKAMGPDPENPAQYTADEWRQIIRELPEYVEGDEFDAQLWGQIRQQWADELSDFEGRPVSLEEAERFFRDTERFDDAWIQAGGDVNMIDLTDARFANMVSDTPIDGGHAVFVDPVRGVPQDLPINGVGPHAQMIVDRQGNVVAQAAWKTDAGFEVTMSMDGGIRVIPPFESGASGAGKVFSRFALVNESKHTGLLEEYAEQFPVDEFADFVVDTSRPLPDLNGGHLYVWDQTEGLASYVGKVDGPADMTEWRVSRDSFRVSAYDAGGNRLLFNGTDEWVDVSHARMAELVENATEATLPGMRIGGVEEGATLQRIAEWRVTRLDENLEPVPGATEVMPGRMLMDDRYADVSRSVDDVMAMPEEGLRGDIPVSITRTVQGSDAVGPDMLQELVEYLFRTSLELDNTAKNALSSLRRIADRDGSITWDSVVEALKPHREYLNLFRTFMLRNNILSISGLGPNKVNWLFSKVTGKSARIPADAQNAPLPPRTAAGRELEEALDGDLARIEADLTDATRTVDQAEEAQRQARELGMAAHQRRVRARQGRAKWASAKEEIELIKQSIDEGEALTKEQVDFLRMLIKRLALPDDGALLPRKYSIEDTAALLAAPSWMGGTGRRLADRLLGRLGAEAIIPTLAKETNPARINEWFQGNLPREMAIEFAETKNPEAIASLVREIVGGRGDLFDAMARTSRAYFTDYAPRMPLTPMVAKAMERTGQAQRVGRQASERARESTWVDVRNASKGAYALGMYLKTIGLRSERADELVAKFMRAPTEEERLNVLLYSVMDGVRDSILDEAGMALDSEFGQAIHEATRAFPGGNLRDWRKYYQDRITHGSVPPTIDVDGKSFKFMSPHLEIELLDTGMLLPSTTQVRQLNTKFGRLGYKAANGELQENVLGVAKRWASNFNDLWRSWQLVRGAYVLRNIAETQYRAYLFGHHNMFTNPLMFMGMVTALGSPKVGRALHSTIGKRFERYQNLAPGVTVEDMYKIRQGKELDDWIDEQGTFIDAMVEEYVNEVVGLASPNDYRPLSQTSHSSTKEWVSRADGEKFRLAHSRSLLMLSMDPMTRVVADPFPVLRNAGWTDDALQKLDERGVQEAVIDVVMDENGPFRATLEKRYYTAHKSEREGWFNREFVRKYMFDWDHSIANRIEETTGGNQRLREFLSSAERRLVNDQGTDSVVLDARSALRRAAIAQQGPVRTRERQAAFEELDRTMSKFISENNMDGGLADDQVFVWIQPTREGATGRKVGDAFFEWAGNTEKIIAWSPEWRTAFVREGIRNLDLLHPEDALEWITFVEKTLPKVKRGSNPISPGSYWDIKSPLKAERLRHQKRLDDMPDDLKGANRRYAETDDIPLGFIASDNREALEWAVRYGNFERKGNQVKVNDVDRTTGEVTERWVKMHPEPQEGMVGVTFDENGAAVIGKQMGFEDIYDWRIKDQALGYATVDEVKRLAAQAASRHVKDLYYHAASTSNWSHAWRIMFPFVSPQMNGYRSFARSTMDWTRLATRHYPALKAFESGMNEGSAVINSTLDYIEPGTTATYDNNTDGETPNRPFLWKDAQGNVRARIPFMGSVMGGFTDAVGLTEGLRNQEMSWALSSMNLFFQGAQPIPAGAGLGEQAGFGAINLLPGAGPMLQTAGSAVPFVRESYSPAGRVMNRWLYPYGRPSDIADVALNLTPAWSRYMAASIWPYGNTTAEWRARDERAMLNYHASRNTGAMWASDPLAQQDLQDRVRRDSIVMGLIRGIGGFIGPVVPRWEGVVENDDGDMLVQAYVAEEFYQIREKAPGWDEAVMAFMDRFGDNLLPLISPNSTGTMSTPSLQAFNQLIRNDDLVPFREVINYFYPGERDWVPYEYTMRKQYRRSLTLDEKMKEAARFVADMQKTQLDRRAILNGWSDERVEYEEKQWKERWEGVPGATGNLQFLTNEERLAQIKLALNSVPQLRESKPGRAALEAFERLEWWEDATENSIRAKSSTEERTLFHAEVMEIFGDDPQNQEMRRLFIKATSERN